VGRAYGRDKKFLQNYELKGTGHVEDLGIDWRRKCKCVLKKQGDKLWTGFTWCGIGNSGALL
jgi:hypothetical protein